MEAVDVARQRRSIHFADVIQQAPAPFAEKTRTPAGTGQKRDDGTRRYRTVYCEVPKKNGKKRPLGVPSVEDKVVQMGIKKILEAIYEEDFLSFSYGFRPRRSCHQALDRLDKKIMKEKVNYVIDADIRGFFDTIDHKWNGEHHRIICW